MPRNKVSYLSRLIRKDDMKPRYSLILVMLCGLLAGCLQFGYITNPKAVSSQTNDGSGYNQIVSTQIPGGGSAPTQVMRDNDIQVDKTESTDVGANTGDSAGFSKGSETSRDGAVTGDVASDSVGGVTDRKVEFRTNVQSPANEENTSNDATYIEPSANDKTSVEEEKTHQEDTQSSSKDEHGMNDLDIDVESPWAEPLDILCGREVVVIHHQTKLHRGGKLTGLTHEGMFAVDRLRFQYDDVSQITFTRDHAIVYLS